MAFSRDTNEPLGQLPLPPELQPEPAVEDWVPIPNLKAELERRECESDGSAGNGESGESDDGDASSKSLIMNDLNGRI